MNNFIATPKSNQFLHCYIHQLDREDSFICREPNLFSVTETNDYKESSSGWAENPVIQDFEAWRHS